MCHLPTDISQISQDLLQKLKQGCTALVLFLSHQFAFAYLDFSISFVDWAMFSLLKLKKEMIN